MSIFIILVLIAIIVIISALVYNDRPFWALASLTVMATVYSLWIEPGAYLNWWAYLQENWVKLIIYFIGYMTVGVLWSFFQFKRFVRRGKEEGLYRSQVSPGENLDKITNWMVFWVISVPMYFLTVPIQDLCKWIYRQFGGVYEKIVVNIYGAEETHDHRGQPKR